MLQLHSHTESPNQVPVNCQSNLKRKVRSPYPLEEDRHNLYLKLGDYRSASRTPDTFTRGPSPSNTTNTTNNHFQLGFMTQDAGSASSTYWTPGPCTARLWRLPTIVILSVPFELGERRGCTSKQ